MTTETSIIFKNKNNEQLVGVLHQPPGRQKFPAVIICHGFGGAKSDKKFVRLARALVKVKTACFRFDFTGCGDSEGDFTKVTIKRQIADLDQAITFLQQQKNINKNKIAFLGHSLGGAIAALYAARNNFPAKTLIFWAPAFNQKELFKLWDDGGQLAKWKKQGFIIRKENKIGRAYLEENENKDYSSIIAKIKAPILIIHGAKDETVPVKFSQKLAQNFKNVKLQILLQADHKFEDYNIQARLVKETVRWIKKTN